jgi:hypothetical protein
MGKLTVEQLQADLSLCKRESEIEDTWKFMYANEFSIKTIKKGFTDGMMHVGGRIIIQETKMLRKKNVTRCPFLSAMVQAMWYAFDDEDYVDAIINNSDKYFTHFVFKQYPEASEVMYKVYKEVRSLASPSKAWSIPKVREIMKNLDSMYGFFNKVKLVDDRFNLETEMNDIMAKLAV